MKFVAYLTAEIGLWSDLHTYSGGLGVLAGDHIKSAADAGLPLVGMTLLYREGYGKQHLDDEGIQSESYNAIDPTDHLIDTKIEVSLPLDGTEIHAKIWKAEIFGTSGNLVPVFFLDTMHPKNSKEHVELGMRLYGGDDAVRIRQEYLLGVGGVRGLGVLGFHLLGLHLNEGHCAFALLELLNKGWSREDLRKNVLFTTHTPVPAGHDRFEWEDVESVLGELLPSDSRELVKNAGDPENGGRISMSHLAVALSGPVNGVSRLNSEVASPMFANKPIEPITNGVHHVTWTGPAMAELFSQKLPGWIKNPDNLAGARQIPSDDLWQARELSRKILREHVKQSTGVELHPDRLTIGFARRFATYKRANLIFSDLERLRELGKGKIQFVFSGKAHPKDEGGKALIKSIFESAKDLEEDIPVAFLEDYSMETGLVMTSGVDVWLNNPIRPMEASGTSGMKAAMNGVLNCSILDGWWPEGCEHGINGWAIGESDDERDDVRDTKNVHDVLENQVIPLWYENKEKWSQMMKSSIATSARFTGARMINDYRRFYDLFE